ncbi:MAG: type II secretion system major pseudopilin GspG [Nitrospirota bacterium]
MIRRAKLVASPVGLLHDPQRKGRFPGVPLAHSGFTLIEVMVVVTILAILAILVVPKIVGRTDDARRTAAIVEIKNLEEALHLYKLDNAFYPTTEQGLEALVTKPTSSPIPERWRTGGYVAKVPKDPWNNDYVYLSPGTHGDFDLLSYGGDGERGGEDKDADLENWDLK